MEIIKQGDRVKLNKDHKITLSNILLNADTIGTVRSFITSEDIVLIQYGYDMEKDQPLLAGVPIDLVYKVDKEDLRSLDHRNLVIKRWHVGNYVMQNDTETVFLLKDIQLEPNESDDLYTSQIVSGLIDDIYKFTRYDLEAKMIPVESPIVANLINKENETKNSEKNINDDDSCSWNNVPGETDIRESYTVSGSFDDRTEEETIDNIELVINGFRFIIEMDNSGNRIITSTEITEENISGYYDAIYKINRIIKWR